MLKIITQLADIDFRQLMDVYQQTNMLSGELEYPLESQNLQLLYAEQDFYWYLNAFFSDNFARYAVLIVDCRYVSAVRLERYQDGILLAGLETAPQNRRKGYARKLLCSVTDHLSQNGSGKLYSHIRKDNSSSLSLHLSIGFRLIDNSAVYLDGIVHNESYTLCLTY